MNDLPTDPLDELLDGSAPLFPVTPRLQPELAHLAKRARSHAARLGSFGRRAAIVGVIGALAAGGTAAAAAAGGWVPSIDDPDVIFEFTLPSGDVCQMAIGDVGAGGRDDVVTAVEDILRNGDVYARADIAGQLAEPLDSDYAANSDEVYRTAVIIAINKVVGGDLNEKVPDWLTFDWHGDDSCMRDAG